MSAANGRGSGLKMAMRRAATTDVCPVELKSLRRDEDSSANSLDRETPTKSSTKDQQEEEGTPDSGGQRADGEHKEEWIEDELGRLDMDLLRKSRQHNLTSNNVRAILHEVITHEHVVSMMKAAIKDTQDQPMFEPKMTRSRLKQAGRYSQLPNWSLSADTVRHPQFVDIDLKDDEDSSDEEYYPDEEEEEDEEEEDTAEETVHSDADSVGSLPRRHLRENPRLAESLQIGLQVQTSVSAAQDLLAVPHSSSFLDRLNAVDAELNCSAPYTFNQSLDKKAADDGEDTGCLACRTRSKLPLVNIPLGQLEAALLAPDITADMYEQSAAQREEDRHWAQWLQGLLDPDNLEEADDDDDPEYNFVDDLEKPDKEDYRTDRAVQITRKEVNELLEELFQSLQEEKQQQQQQQQQQEEAGEEASSQTGPNFNTPQALCFEMPLAEMLTEQRRTLRKQYESVQQRRALQDMTNQGQNKASLKQIAAITPVLMMPGLEVPSLHLNSAQKPQLQQQMQQHVQLLTQVHLLCRNQDSLKHEACTTKQYLEELIHFTRTQEELVHRSSFRVCNLQAALDLLQEVEQRAAPPPVPRAPISSKGWLPRMAPATNSHAFPLLPVEDAWLFATRSIFLYPEILPVCRLDKKRNQRVIYTPGENGLIVLALKHFEGTLETDQLISSYLLCKSRWSIRKHIREMSMAKMSPDNVIKTFKMGAFVQPPPFSCSTVQPGEQRPPVDRVTANSPKWLKNSQLNIQKTSLSPSCYPRSLPPGCSLRLHPHFVTKARPSSSSHRRIFTLAHNTSLLPLAKAPAESARNSQSAGHQPLPSEAVRTTSSSAVLAHCHTDNDQSDFSCKQGTSRQQNYESAPSLPIQASPDCTSPLLPAVATSRNSGSLLQPMMWTPPALPTAACAVTIQHDPEQQIQSFSTGPGPSEKKQSSRRPSAQSPRSVQQEEPEVQYNPPVVEVTSLNGGENTSRQEQERKDGDRKDGGGEEEPEEGRGDGKHRGEEEGENGGGEGEEEGEKDKSEDQDKDDDQEEEEEEEEEEDFDDLTQDEDEEEVMSSASEESVLSVPELQETMKQLTWLAAEQRHGTDGDSEEEHSPTSPGSQEEEEEEDEEGPKGQEEEVEEERSSKQTGEGLLSAEDRPGGAGRCPARGRGRGRPLRGLRRSRQERHSKDATKLLLLYDDHILDNDPFRESKDVAFAQSYLRRVREALQDDPVQVEDFVSLLHDFEQLGEGQEVMPLFRKLRNILGDQSDLLRDFAAFLYPEQALQCGLFEEQQAFERSRRFLRQLEISFGDNPSHYQKIIKALQTSPDLNPAGIDELKSQMVTLLKGHTHLQAEFWVFFEELHPPTANPGQFEESHWPETGDSLVCRGEAAGGFEEVSLPDLDEEEDGPKIQPMTHRRQRRKMGTRRNYKGYDWSPKDWPCHCPDARHRRKGCTHCHGNKSSGAVSRAMKGLDPVYSQLACGHSEAGDKDLDVKRDSPRPEQSNASCESVTLTDGKEEELEKEEDEEERKKESSYPTVRQNVFASSLPICLPVSSAPPPPPDPPVCAKNISLTASGEKVILWTREADRVILTRCQQDGANQNTFQAISSLLGNKTPTEVFRRFQDLMGLFRTAARQSSSEEETAPTDVKAAVDEDC